MFENAAVKHNVEYGCFSLSAMLLVIRVTNRKNVCKKKIVSISYGKICHAHCFNIVWRSHVFIPVAEIKKKTPLVKILLDQKIQVIWGRSQGHFSLRETWTKGLCLLNSTIPGGNCQLLALQILYPPDCPGVLLLGEPDRMACALDKTKKNDTPLSIQAASPKESSMQLELCVQNTARKTSCTD